ncbi:MAG: GtrA family protein [Anaerolineae bacterium]|nr:GtrA family protein [Anaerolineae bacterium]
MAAFPYRLHINHSTRTLMRSLSVSAMGTLVDLSLFTVLHVAFDLPALIVNTLSYSAGGLNTYFMHRRWTYASRPKKTMGLQFLQFVLVSVFALLVNNLLIGLLTPYFSGVLDDAGFAGLAAKLCATSAGMLWNYTVNNRWTFSVNNGTEQMELTEYANCMDGCFRDKK